MGDEKDTTPLSPVFQAAEYLLFGHGVERGSRFIENQNRGTLDDGACDDDTLALASRQLRRTFPERRLVAFSKRLDESVRACHAGGFCDLVRRRLGLSEADILENAG